MKVQRIIQYLVSKLMQHPLFIDLEVKCDLKEKPFQDNFQLNILSNREKYACLNIIIICSFYIGLHVIFTAYF